MKTKQIKKRLKEIINKVADFFIPEEMEVVK